MAKEYAESVPAQGSAASDIAAAWEIALERICAALVTDLERTQ